MVLPDPRLEMAKAIMGNGDAGRKGGGEYDRKPKWQECRLLSFTSSEGLKESEIQAGIGWGVQAEAAGSG
jgi:hypothetical protein